ncbi:hypothetical protein [Jiangella asiatica]|uniref:LppX_LprAFG lipoprotein n=1 Tax=Jiangella asiatica TaxID=2530372 RepID=A0A4R5DB81_9ACTN|nr:hypothetical protein [Jiangella asiatica]TDE08764.1 hypothetical protein E1269_16480 [Jiangella asiatica]
MQLVVRRLAAAATTVALTVALTACTSGPEHQAVAPLAQISMDERSDAANGINELAPPEVLERAITAMRGAGTYRVTGTTVAGNAIDIAFHDGVGSTGTVGTETTVQLVATTAGIYVTGDTASLAAQVGADVDTTIAGKWLLISAEAASGFAIFADGSAFASAVLGAEAPTNMTEVTEVDGQPAVGLLFPETGGTLWVAATGEPLPLRLEEKGASVGAGVITFSGYGTEVAITPPAEDAVVDLTKIPAS